MPPAKNSRPRDLAVKILTRVLSEKTPLDAALDELAPAEHRAWLQELCTGTLRWKGRLDSIIDSNSLKKKPTGNLRKVLLLASYQLIVQDRTHAALIVSETVDEIKKLEGDAPAKFANAVLRKIADHAGEWRNLPCENAAWASLPEWIWNKCVHQRGIEWTEKFAQACLERPQHWVRAKRDDWHPEWAKKGEIPFSFEVVQSGAIPDKEGFAEGEFYVQDISSQFLIREVARLVQAAIKNPSAVDLCAAPGGKTVGLAWSGFRVTASDSNEKRIALLEENLKRLQLPVPVKPFAELEASDLVWVDAPCSATGIIRRHPDVRWLRQESDLTALTRLQKDLLKKGMDLTRAGGFLAYSVCSVLKEEGERLIKSIPDAEFEKIAEWNLAPHIPPLGDGFYAALIRKK
jgi:16S rRNA (cytosine967-C5)-methyltransferase